MEKKTKVLIIGNYNVSVLKKLSPGFTGCWNDTMFDFSPEGDYDYTIVLNYPERTYQVSCPPDNIWAIMQEPYIKGNFEWMKNGHEMYTKVFTHDPPNSDEKYIRSPPLLAWYIGKSYDDLSHMHIPQKNKCLSFVSSKKSNFKGHRKRISFIDDLLKEESLQFDLFGRGFHQIEDKWDALAPYYFSIAIENTSKEDYWTEKIADCFLAYTVPIYYGCTNIEDYFPKKSCILIDIDDPEEAKEIMRKLPNKNEWKKRLPYIKKARELVLNDYNMLNVLSHEIEKDGKQYSENCEILIKKYTHSPVDLLIRLFDRFIFKN